jgi:uncharacterized membrane protein (Fun14 family)
MRHLTVGIFVVSIIILSVHYNVIKINLDILFKNVESIVVWIVHLMLALIITSWFR